MSGQAASLGFSTLMNWAGLISVSIGLLNLFPIPLLDGGHLLFYGIEAIRGRPLSERVQEVGFRIGFALIVMLMIFTVWNDLSHFRVVLGAIWGTVAILQLPEAKGECRGRNLFALRRKRLYKRLRSRGVLSGAIGE